MDIRFEWLVGYRGVSEYTIRGGPDNGRRAKVLWWRPSYLRASYREGLCERHWNGTRRDWIGERLGASGLLAGVDAWIALSLETVSAFHAQYDKDDDGDETDFNRPYYRVNHRTRDIRPGVYDLDRKRWVKVG